VLRGGACGFLVRCLIPIVAGLHGAWAIAAGQQYVFNRLDFATGNRPSGTAIADVKGDGRQDLIVVNQTDGTVSVLLGMPDGTFGSRTDVSAGTGPHGIVIGDFNEDGKIDIAVTNTCGPSCGNISVLLGNGDGTFQKSVNFQAGGFFATVFDLNGDGKPDIISAGQTNSVAVFINQTGPYSISGTIRDSNSVPLSSVTVTLSGGAPVIINTDGTGTYAFNDLTAGQTYTVTPTKTNYTFAPLNQVFSKLSSNATGDFVGTLNNYSISGKVRDSFRNGMAGVTMTLSGSMSGAMTSAIFRLRLTQPMEKSSHEKGFIIANIRIVGASNRNMGIAAFHLGPRRTEIKSSPKRAQAMVTGTVSASTSE